METNTQVVQLQESIQILNQLKLQLNANHSLLQLNATLYPTKGNAGAVNAEFYRDLALEENVRKWIESRSTVDIIMRRYQQHDSRLEDLSWPRHFATHFINVDGILKNMKNIFMFFPEVLGIHGNSGDDYFGLEFIDIWSSVFNEIIFPCMRKVFDNTSLKYLYSSLRPQLEKTIFLASVFHEIGHRISIWKVSPVKDDRLCINKFHTDVFGELSTDMFLVNHLSEFPEILYFVFLQRIFWFGRFDFSQDTISGALNRDNDTWISAYLWQHYVDHKAIVMTDIDSWHVDIDSLPNVFRHILEDLIQLESDVVKVPKDEQDIYLATWMKKRVPYKNGRFIYPDTQRELFIRCITVPELPTIKF